MELKEVFKFFNLIPFPTPDWERSPIPARKAISRIQDFIGGSSLRWFWGDNIQLYGSPASFITNAGDNPAMNAKLILQINKDGKSFILLSNIGRRFWITSELIPFGEVDELIFDSLCPICGREDCGILETIAEIKPAEGHWHYSYGGCSLTPPCPGFSADPKDRKGHKTFIPDSPPPGWEIGWAGAREMDRIASHFSRNYREFWAGMCKYCYIYKPKGGENG